MKRNERIVYWATFFFLVTGILILVISSTYPNPSRTTLQIIGQGLTTMSLCPLILLKLFFNRREKRYNITFSIKNKVGEEWDYRCRLSVYPGTPGLEEQINGKIKNIGDLYSNVTVKVSECRKLNCY